MTLAARFPLHAVRVGRPRTRRGSFWAPLAVGFLTGAAFALGLAEANRSSLDRARSDPVIIPPTVSPHPFAPPIRIGKARLLPVLDAPAPASSSAAMRRNGDRPLTAGLSSTTHTGRRA